MKRHIQTQHTDVDRFRRRRIRKSCVGYRYRESAEAAGNKTVIGKSAETVGKKTVTWKSVDVGNKPAVGKSAEMGNKPVIGKSTEVGKKPVVIYRESAEVGNNAAAFVSSIANENCDYEASQIINDQEPSSVRNTPVPSLKIKRNKLNNGDYKLGTSSKTASRSSESPLYQSCTN